MKQIIKNKLLFLVTLILLLLISMYLLFQLSKSRTYQIFGEFIPRVNTEEKVIALTFDDGPNENTENVLHILNDKNVKATFFLIGEEIERHQDITKSIVDQGHDIGNHSYSHSRFLLKSQSFISNEIEKTNFLIRSSGYAGEITFRPPNGKRLFGLPWYLQQHNIKTILWDVEPDTYVDISFNDKERSDFYVTYILNNTKSGSIILMHPNCSDGCESERDALPRIIDELKLLGYRFVTISELLTYQNK